MKISGKFILKVAGTLTIISLVVALLLGLVNGVTADKIAAMNAAATQTALEAVTEAGSTYDEITSIPQEVMDAAKEMGGTLEEMYGHLRRPACRLRCEADGQRLSGPHRDGHRRGCRAEDHRYLRGESLRDLRYRHQGVRQ